MPDLRLEIGSTYALPKSDFDSLLARLRADGYLTMGPRVDQNSLVYDEISSLADLPQGYVSEQEAGQPRRKPAGGAAAHGAARSLTFTRHFTRNQQQVGRRDPAQKHYQSL